MKKAGTYSAEVRSPMSKSFLYSRSCHDDILEIIKLHTLMAEDGLDALFFYFYLFRFKMSPSPLVTTGIQVLPRYFRNSSLFYCQL